MIRIGICDDVKREQEEMESLCYQFFQAKEEPVEFVYFEAGEEVVQYSGKLDILFLKVEINSMNGIQVKNYLEYKESCTKIIFLSNCKERMQETFGINVCAFLEKPIQKEQLFRCMEKIWVHIRTRDLGIQHDAKREIGKITISLADILYVESQKHYCELVCREKRIRIRKHIKELEEELCPLMFFRCHRSYLVNFYQIKNLDKHIVMMNGDCIMISRSRRQTMKQKYVEFLRNYIEV